MIHGRNTKQLGVVWATLLVAIYLVYRLESNMPALHEILLPAYFIFVGLGLLATWKWLRLRSPKDRRGEDRRLADRRDDLDDPPATS